MPAGTAVADAGVAFTAADAVGTGVTGADGAVAIDPRGGVGVGTLDAGPMHAVSSTPNVRRLHIYQIRRTIGSFSV